MSIAKEYSENWKNLGSLLVHQCDNFQFHNNVIITDFENCLIKNISNSSLYHTIYPKDIQFYNVAFVKKLREASNSCSIVIISNNAYRNKLSIDILKRKMEFFLNEIKFPFLALFIIKKNRLYKPHTGAWNFLKLYYKTQGNTNIQNACIISNNGGRVFSKELKNGITQFYSDKNDIDRAFAENIGIPFYTINEYVSGEKENLTWNHVCLPPEIREQYINKLSEYKNPNIFASLFSIAKSDTYMILLYGSPRSGKTTIAKSIIKKWNASEYGKTHAIKRLGLDKFTKAKRLNYTKKLIKMRISVIIDGDMHRADLRADYEEIAKKYKIPILYLEINPGIAMSYLFNHLAVENANSEDICIYDEKEYHLYKSTMTRPENVVLLCPEIQKSTKLMTFRF